MYLLTINELRQAAPQYLAGYRNTLHSEFGGLRTGRANVSFQ